MDEPCCTLRNLLLSNKVRLDRKHNAQKESESFASNPLQAWSDGWLKHCWTHSQSLHKLPWFPSFASRRHGKGGFNKTTEASAWKRSSRSRKGKTGLNWYSSTVHLFWTLSAFQWAAERNSQSQRVYIWQVRTQHLDTFFVGGFLPFFHVDWVKFQDEQRQVSVICWYETVEKLKWEKFWSFKHHHIIMQKLPRHGFYVYIWTFGSFFWTEGVVRRSHSVELSVSQLVAQPNSFSFCSCQLMYHYVCWGEMCIFYIIYARSIMLLSSLEYDSIYNNIVHLHQVHCSSGIGLSLFCCSKKHTKFPQRRLRGVSARCFCIPLPSSFGRREDEMGFSWWGTDAAGTEMCNLWWQNNVGSL